MGATIILADDHPLLLNGTKEFLEKHRYSVIATATNGNEAYNLIAKLNPKIAVLDFDMPVLNGLEVAAEVKKKHIKTLIVILTLHKQETIIAEVGNSIHGYITKDCAMEELDDCLKALQQNKTYISPKLKSNVKLSAGNSLIDTLTATELKILKQIDKNLTSTQIAELLFISKRTVEKHRSNIIKKLELDSTNQNALFIWLKEHPNILNT